MRYNLSPEPVERKAVQAVVQDFLVMRVQSERASVPSERISPYWQRQIRARRMSSKFCFESRGRVVLRFSGTSSKAEVMISSMDERCSLIGTMAVLPSVSIRDCLMLSECLPDCVIDLATSFKGLVSCALASSTSWM